MRQCSSWSTWAHSSRALQSCHVILTGMSPEKSPEDCWAVLRAAKNDFLAVLGKVYPEEMPLECAECCLVLYYLEATVILKHLQPPGVVEHMTVQEWMTRSTSEADHTVIVVKEHKTSAQQAATFALSSEEETWFDIYFTQVRPQLLSSKRSRTTLDDLGGDKRFFVSTAGRPAFNASNDLNRLHQKYKLDPVTYQTARRIFETATKDLTDQEKSLVADYLTHSTATADEHYRMKQSRNVVLASKLLKKLAGDSSADSAEEGPSCSARGAARDAALASNQQMDVQAAFDQLLRTHPVTLDGDIPDKTARSQTSGRFQRQLYDRWLKAQMRMRVRHVLSHFGRRQPTESRVDAWIRNQGWKSNVPSAASVLKDWRPVGSVDTAMDSSHIQELIHNQNTSNRHFLLCPVCKKTQASLSVHLTRVCMKRSSKEAIQEVVEKAKQDALEVLQWGRVFSYRHLRDIMDDANPMSRMIQELERRHMVVPDTPSPAVAAQTSSVPVMAGTTVQRPESSATEQSEDAVSVSNGEIFQVTREVQWPQTSRHMMQEKGLIS
ncbi:uncharacterized protein [Paramormyrops kingsleyae]|uniref:uncharacterized protein n=1 Tax=Paramormyrops kingsleyae TaxID=1676925 RepID=UPI003B971D8F